MTPDRRFLSYGGGTQSAALALMSAEGDLPRLDAVIFADTQGELPETYEYAEYVKVRLAEAGIPFVVATAGSLYDHLVSETRGQKNPTPPAFVLNPDGSAGRVRRYRCSYDFKRRIIEREEKALCGKRGDWKRSTVEQWMGFSTDEAGRCKPDNGCRCAHLFARHLDDPDSKTAVLGPCNAPGCDCQCFSRWRENVYPLIDLGFCREDTIAWFSANGHPTPARSACYFCPNSSNERWRQLREQHPDLLEKACVLDESIRFGGAFSGSNKETFKGRMFLHRDRIPLAQVDLRTQGERLFDAGVRSLFDDLEIEMACEGESCFT